MVYLTFFLLFFSPLIIFPFDKFSFEPPKVILAEGIIDLMVLLMVSRTGISWRKYNFQHLILAGGIFGLSIIHLIFFQTPTTFFGNVFRLQGIFLLWHLLLWSVISSRINLKNLPFWLYLIPLAGLFLGANFLGSNEEGRAVGTLGEPNALAAVSLFFWPVVGLNPGLKASLKKIIFLLCFIIACWIIFISGSKAAVLGLLAQSIFLILVSFKKISLGKASVISLIFILASFSLPLLEKGRIYEDRSEIWLTALVSGFNQPVFGTGFGNMEEAIKNTGLILRNNIQYQYIDSSHNLILDWFLQAGLIGVSLLVLLLWDALGGLVRQGRKTELVCFIGLLTVMMFNPVSIVNLLAFWWLVGQGFLTKE